MRYQLPLVAMFATDDIFTRRAFSGKFKIIIVLLIVFLFVFYLNAT